MKKDEMSSFTQNLSQKIGDEKAGLIADDLGKLIADNAQMNKTIEDLQKDKSRLEKEKENLITTNGNLLQQVSMGFSDDDNNLSQEKEDNKKREELFNRKNWFDERGNFKM